MDNSTRTIIRPILPIITTINIRHEYRVQQTDEHLLTTRKSTGHNLRKTQSQLSLRSPYPATYTLPIEFLQTYF